MSPDTSNSICWVISDGAAGNERQAAALAGALQLGPRVVRLQLGPPWGWLSPHLTWRAQSAVRDESGTPITAPWPDIAIGCGRKAALLTRCLRTWSKGHCFTVQILDPRTRTDLFDVVVAPRHDHLSGANVIETLGALNPINETWLENGRSEFPRIGELPSPRTGVLIGASNNAVTLDEDYFTALMASLGMLHTQHGGSFLVSTSRRTPIDRIALLRSRFSQWPGIFWAGPEDGENLYAGILGWADRIIVSADSVNMISEACATGKPVHAFSYRPISGKLADFHEVLSGEGHLSPADAETPTIPVPLRELDSVATQVCARWRDRLLSPSPAGRGLG